MAFGDEKSLRFVGVDSDAELHSLEQRLRFDCGLAVELWTTVHGELVLRRREIPKLQTGDKARSQTLDALAAKLNLT